MAGDPIELPRVLVVQAAAEEPSELVALLRELAYDAVLATTGARALELMRATRFTAVLTDRDLPDFGAVGLLRTVRRLRIETPVLVVLNAPSVDDVLHLVREGCADVLPLPLSLHDVADAIDRVDDRPRRRRPPKPKAPSRDPGSAPWPLSAVSKESPTDISITREDAAPEPPPKPAPVPEPVPVPEPEAEAESDPPEASRRSDPRLRRAVAAKLRARLDAGDLDLLAIGPVTAEIQQLLANPACSAAEVAQLILREPTIVSAILRRANSSYYRGGQAVTDLKTACTRLGNRRVLVLAQEALVKTAFDCPPGPLRDVLEAMWRNVIVTARAGRELAARTGLRDPDEVEVAAMLHNVGELVLLRLAPAVGVELRPGCTVPHDLAEVVMRSHEQAGRDVLRKWKMPASLVQLAGAHHKRPSSPESRDATALRRLVGLAWMAACEAGYTYLPWQDRADPSAYLAKLDVDRETLDAILADAPKWIGEANGGG